MSHMMKPVEKQQSLRISGDLGHKALTKMFQFQGRGQKKKKSCFVQERRGRQVARTAFSTKEEKCLLQSSADNCFEYPGI